MYLNHKTNCQNGDPITADDWNHLASDVNDLGAGNNSSSSTDTHMYVNDKGNLCIETTVENTPSGKGKINIESKDDLQLKPGDDFNLCAHHRGAGNTDLVLIKVLTETNDETEIPANIKINSGGSISLTNKDNVGAIMVEINPNYTKNKLDYNMTSDFVEGTFVNGGIYTNTQITSKFSGKTFDNANASDVLDDILNAGVSKNRKIRVSNGDNTYTCYTFTKVTNADSITNVNIEGPSGYGYLKVRAQAIDLRCEDHGGIALLPKGVDSDNFENKIKFEHGGGDGLEFGTFNTQHTSIFTTDYRFNKDGVIRLAERFTEVSDKANANDSTTAYKYIKNNAENNAAKALSESKTFDQADDFYDFVDSSDPTCTWEDIVTYIHWAKTNNLGPWANPL